MNDNIILINNVEQEFRYIDTQYSDGILTISNNADDATHIYIEFDKKYSLKFLKFCSEIYAKVCKNEN